MIKKIIIIISLLLISVSGILACEDNDYECYQNVYNDNPSPENFANLKEPTVDDFKKLPNPKDKESFYKLDKSGQQKFFTESNSNINDNKVLFQDYLIKEKVPIESINGPITNFDGTTLIGTNGNIANLNDLKNRNDISLLVDNNGNIIIKNKKGSEITFNDGQISVNKEGKIEVKVNKGEINIKDSNNLDSSLNFILEKGTKINLENGNFVEVDKQTLMKIGEIERKEFLSNNEQLIVYNPKENIIAASGEKIKINYFVDNIPQIIEVGKSSTQKGVAIVSKNTLDLVGYTKVDVKGIKFETDSKDFFKKIKQGNDIKDLEDLNLQQSINFYSEKKGKDRTDLIGLELNIYRNANNEKFFEDSNKILDKFIEEEIKSDPKLRNEIDENIKWIKKNSEEIGLDSNEKIQNLLQSLENKLTTNNKELIPVETFLGGFKEIKNYIENENTQIDTNLEKETIERFNNLANSIGQEKTSKFIVENFPKNTNYVIDYDMIKEFGLEKYTSFNGIDLVDKNSKVFINTFNNGELNVDLIANNKIVPLDDKHSAHTENRVILGVKPDIENKKVHVLIDGIEIDDSYNLHTLIYDDKARENKKGCVYLTWLNKEECFA